MEDISFDETDRLVRELSGILAGGKPEATLNEDAAAMRFSDILDLLSEEGSLSRLLELPGLTPEWSLFIRNYLELSHDRFDLEGLDTEESLSGDHESQDAVFGIGLFIDADRSLPPSIALTMLSPLAQVLESVLEETGHDVEVFLHPRLFSLADLYTFSYEGRRRFIEERLAQGFSMDPEESAGSLPVMAGESMPGSWDQPAAAILGRNDPVFRSLGGSLELGRGAIVGVVRISPPYPEEWGEVLDNRFSDALQEKVGKAVAGILEAVPSSSDGPSTGEGQVSIMPWSLLLPMGVTVSMGAFLAEGLESGRIHSERVGMTPVWREGALWIEVDGTPSSSGPLRYLAIDEYVGHFMENYVPNIMESMMGLSVRWNKRKGGGRALSLGVL